MTGSFPGASTKNGIDSCESRNKTFLIFAYLQVFIVIILTLTGKLDYKINYIFNSFYYLRQTGLTYHLLTMAWIICAAYGNYILYRTLSTAPPEKKMQIRYLLFATAIGFFSGGLSHFLVAYGISLHPAWNAFIIIYTSLASYAIFRHRVLGFDIVIRKGLVYTLLISLATILYFVALVLIEKMFQKSIGYNSLFATIIILGIIVVLAEPLRVKIQSTIDTLFFKGSLVKVAEERELLHKEMQKQDRLKAISTLAAGMAHEIKNPLTSIKTFVEYLPAKYDDPEFRDKFTRIVADEVARVNNIVKQLLEFSKPQVLALKKESITSILDDTLNLLNNNLLNNKIEVIKKYGREILLPVDKNQLKQAFLNIFLNSIQAMPSGGVLTISTSHNHDSLLITVSDTGTGISHEQLSHVFDPFFTTKESGTGLGLSIVHGIITKHGGKIDIQSKEGEGTTVSVTLKNRG